MTHASKYPAPDVEGLDPGLAHRVLMTVSCHDSDVIPKVVDAGSIIERDGRELQVMHNGLLIERGCYYGPWMDQIIVATGGHHEPQEELVFHRLIERLHATEGDKCSLEFGSFWAYYTMWFAKEFPGGRSVALEPDPAYLAIGKRNAALNGLESSITFGHGAVGGEPGQHVTFTAESDGRPYDVMQYDLASAMSEFELSHVDILMVDIQGFEQVLLPRAVEQFRDGKVHFLIVSTHHHLISGNAVTHQEMLEVLIRAGAHIIVEHTVSESYSGDGLIAASFDPRDADFTIDVSYNRAGNSLFGAPETDIAEQLRLVAALRSELDGARAAQQAAEKQVADIRATKIWRYSSPVRKAAVWVRSRLRRA